MQIVETQMAGLTARMSQPDIDPVEQAIGSVMSAHGVITFYTLRDIMTAIAEQDARATGLVVAENPGLVGPDGQPVSRQARRQIERKAAEA